MIQARGVAEPEAGFSYWVLRYVPVPVREEFINIGVVVGGENGDWAIRRIHDLGRVNRIGGNPSDTSNWLFRLENRIAPIPTSLDELLDLSPRKKNFSPDSAWMERLRRQQENNFQISEPRPVVAVSASEAADRLYDLLVVAPKERAEPFGRKLAVRALRDEIQMHLSRRAYQPDVRLLAGAQRARVDYAFGRSSVVQLTQVFAFDIKTTDHLANLVQSSSYTLSRLRKAGAEIRNPRRVKQPSQLVKRDVAVRVLYVPPVTDSQNSVFQMALDAWQDLDVKAYALGDEASLVREADQLVASA